MVEESTNEAFRRTARGRFEELLMLTSIQEGSGLDPVIPHQQVRPTDAVDCQGAHHDDIER